MRALGRLVAIVLLLAAGATAGWIGSVLLPPSPLQAVLNLDAGGQPGQRPGGARGQGASPVSVVGLIEAEFPERLRAVGTAMSQDAVEIRPQSDGPIVAIEVEPGQRVEAGRLMFRLESTQEEADVAVTEAVLEDLLRQSERAAAVGDAVSQARRDELRALVAGAEARLRAARYQLSTRTIRAPFAGVVGLIDLSVGALVERDTVLTTLDHTDRMKVSFTVPERYLGSLDLGLAAEIRSAGFSDIVFAGRLASIDTRVNPTTRTIRVEAQVENSEGRLRPGMFLVVDLALSPVRSLAVPDQALIVQGGDAYVFVAEGDKAKRVPVTIGRRRDGLVAISGDLSLEDKVVVAGQQRLRDGAAVTIVEDGAATPPSEVSARPEAG